MKDAKHHVCNQIVQDLYSMEIDSRKDVLIHKEEGEKKKKKKE